MAGHLMVVGGHISDPENMAGAVMLKHKKAGWDITIVHATTGEKGHPTLSAKDYLKMRLADAHASAEFIGANLELMPYGDGELPVNDESIWIMADLIRKHKPTLIITHWKGSFHIDHNNTHDVVLNALFRASLPAFEREYPAHSPQTVLYSENWEDMEGYKADIYLDVSDVFDDYLALLKTHALMRDELFQFPLLGLLQGFGGSARCAGWFRPGCNANAPT